MGGRGQGPSPHLSRCIRSGITCGTDGSETRACGSTTCSRVRLSLTTFKPPAWTATCEVRLGDGEARGGAGYQLRPINRQRPEITIRTAPAQRPEIVAPPKAVPPPPKVVERHHENAVEPPHPKLRRRMSSVRHRSVSNMHPNRPPGMSRWVAEEAQWEGRAAVVDFYP
jgi:hypothetical protein